MCVCEVSPASASALQHGAVSRGCFKSSKLCVFGILKVGHTAYPVVKGGLWWIDPEKNSGWLEKLLSCTFPLDIQLDRGLHPASAACAVWRQCCAEGLPEQGALRRAALGRSLLWDHGAEPGKAERKASWFETATKKGEQKAAIWRSRGAIWTRARRILNDDGDDDAPLLSWTALRCHRVCPSLYPWTSTNLYPQNTAGTKCFVGPQKQAPPRLFQTQPNAWGCSMGRTCVKTCATTCASNDFMFSR